MRALGWIATALSVICKLPQIYLLYAEKSHKGLSLAGLAANGAACAFYAAHGYFIGDLPVLTMGVVSFTQSVCLVAMYFAYRKPRVHKKEEEEKEKEDI